MKKKRQSKKRVSEKRNELAKALKIPMDVYQHASLMQCTGFQELYIEQYLGLMEYCVDQIIILTMEGKIMIGGRELCITYFTKEELKISGKISKIVFQT